jgi:DNA-binding NarL/FixJ family response regulator
MSGPVRVFLVSSDPLARSALAARIGADAALVLAGDGSGPPPPGATADLLVWDLGLEPTAALERIAEAPAPVLALAPDEPSAVEAVAAGARGAILRGGDPGELAAAAAAIAAGLCALDPEVLAALVPVREPAGSPPAEDLTAREREVLQLVAEGLSNRGIAARLGISEHTAKFHVNAILAKLGVQRRSEAVARAARLGLVVF